MADNADAGSDVQVSFKVKTSGDKSHTISMAESAKVIDLKTKLAGEDYENVPVERQRLIYSGRVMKNDDALGIYKIKNGNTIHMVKSAPSNPPATSAAAASAPTPQAIPQNMAAGTAANNLLAGLTGARFAGHANLPSRDLFGADGGMGAPPSDDQVADMLSNPAVVQTMNEALNNPAFIDMIIQQNPALANLPNAREIIQSPYFRSMMTNPDALRQAARMRRMFSGGGTGAAFPAPGATDTTPEGAAAGGNNAGTGGNANPAGNPFAFPPMFGPMFGAGAGAPAAGANAANPFEMLLGGGLGAAPAAGTAPAPSSAATTGTNAQLAADSPAANTTPSGQTTANNDNASAAAQAANPFAALWNPPQGAGGAGAAAFPPITPETMQQAMQFWGPLLGQGPGGVGAGAVPPADNRPPEERYAEQLRQLNDMGFYDFDRNVAALRRSGGSVQGAIEHLLGGS